MHRRKTRMSTEQCAGVSETAVPCVAEIGLSQRLACTIVPLVERLRITEGETAQGVATHVRGSKCHL